MRGKAAAVLLAIASVAQPSDVYVAVLHEYLTGNADAALARLRSMNAVDASAGAHRLARYGDPKLLAAAAALHTEAAVAKRDDEVIWADWHLQLARDIVQYGDLHAKPRRGGIDLSKSRMPPVRAAFRRAWYLVALRHYESWGQLTQLEPLLERTRELYPNDPEILLLDAIADEGNAAPHGPPLTPTERVSRLRNAQRKLRASLDGNPNAVEARLRYGRVLQELGYFADAQRAFVGLPTSTDPRVQYLSSLFLGHLADTMDDQAAAARWYQAAIDALPAQSAVLARSELLHRAGDLDAAAAPLPAVLQRPEDADPWWSYTFGQFWLIDRSRAELRALARQ